MPASISLSSSFQGIGICIANVRNLKLKFNMQPLSFKGRHWQHNKFAVSEENLLFIRNHRELISDKWPALSGERREN